MQDIIAHTFLVCSFVGLSKKIHNKKELNRLEIESDIRNEYHCVSYFKFNLKCLALVAPDWLLPNCPFRSLGLTVQTTV